MQEGINDPGRRSGMQRMKLTAGTKTHMKKFGLFILVFLLFFIGKICSAEEITSKAMLNRPGITIGISQGSLIEDPLRAEFPNASLAYYTDNFMGYESVAAGKIDAFIYDRRQMEISIKNGLAGVHLLNENLDGTLKIAAGISSVSKIPDLESRINRFIAKIQADGTLEDMYQRWVLDENETMPEIPLPENPEYHLTVGTTGTVPPYSYYAGTDLNGYDIELARRFAAWLGADLQFSIYDFDGIIPAAAAGRIDCIMSDLQVDDERRENFTFSDILFEEVDGIMVRGNSAPEFRSFSELNGKTVSMITGAPFEEMVRSKVPNVGGFTYFSNMPDIILALKSGKTDAVLSNNAIASLSVNLNPDITFFPENLEESVFGFAFAKGGTDRDKWQTAFDMIPDETIRAVWEKWTGADESLKVVPEQDWPGLNGVVRAAACDSLEPMSYAGKNGQLMGFDIEMILLTAKILDLHVEFTGMEFSAILPYVQSGKALIGTGSIIITEERKEAVDFLPYYPASFVLVVRTAQGREQAKAPSLPDSLRSSFEKTFIRENRWKLIIEGIRNTVLITVMSVLFGTVLGFLLFLLFRNGNPAATGITRACMWLVQGMPMVVLLMLLFYVIFGSVKIDGILVAVIGFSLTFGASVFSILKIGVGAVDSGQYEASYALGYSNIRTFFRIILPQAVPHVISAYKGEIISLLKATAIVGYIAVQDLTKMGDIIRSRTYEAFFPLIAVTIIYFLLEILLGSVINMIQIRIDPRRRKPEDILKGVKTDD